MQGVRSFFCSLTSIMPWESSALAVEVRRHDGFAHTHMLCRFVRRTEGSLRADATSCLVLLPHPSVDGSKTRLCVMDDWLRDMDGREERTRLAERRAVFVTVSPLLSDIIAEVICRRGRLTLVAQLDSEAELASRLPALAPDLVVIGLRIGESDEISQVALDLVPNAKILVISDDGRHAYLHEMQPRRKVFFDFSPASLLAALDL